MKIFTLVDIDQGFGGRRCGDGDGRLRCRLGDDFRLCVDRF